jgi:hypothetical protein
MDLESRVRGICSKIRVAEKVFGERWLRTFDKP